MTDLLGIDEALEDQSQDPYSDLPPTQVLKEQAEQLRSNTSSMVSAASTDTVPAQPTKPDEPTEQRTLIHRDSAKTLVGDADGDEDENAAPSKVASKASGKRKQSSPSASPEPEPQPQAKRARANTVADKQTPGAGGKKRKTAALSDDEVAEIKQPPAKKAKKKAAGSDDDGPSTSKKKGKTPAKPKVVKQESTGGGRQTKLFGFVKTKSADTSRSLSETVVDNASPAPPDNSVVATGPALLMPKPSAPASLETWTIRRFPRKALMEMRPFFAAHSEKHLGALARAPFAVVWAASRHSDALEKLSDEKMNAVKMGNNVDGVRSLLEAMNCSRDLESFPRTVLEEADIETKAIAVNCAAGFGGDASKAVMAGKPWYGGKVQYCLSIRAREIPGPDEEKYYAVFMPVALGPSCRFSRHGSENWIPVSISKKTFRTQNPEEWTEFFTRPFVVMGRVYQAVYSKEQTKRFLYRTRYRLPQHTHLKFAEPANAMEFLEFMDQHNPFVHNCEQSMQKYIARFALGTSNSVPICQLRPENIRFLPDIYANGKNKANAKSQEIMTDGCGFMNRAGFNLLHSALGLADRCMAIQFRLAGAKGVLVEADQSMDGTDNPNEPRVWLRPSQIKIQYPTLEPRADQPLDVARLILEHLRPARIKTPSRISGLSIINLDSNSLKGSKFKALKKADPSRQLMNEIFSDRFKGTLKNVFDSLTTWETYDDRAKVAQTVDTLGGVTSMRRAQAAGAASRAKGLWYRERKDDDDDPVAPGAPLAEDDEDEDSSDEEDPLESVPTTVADPALDPASAQAYVPPNAMALQMLLAGFHPASCSILRIQLRTILCTSNDQYLQKFRLNIIMSAEGMIIPDDTGALGEDEIFLSSSHKLSDSSGRTVNHLIGDVLIYRNPVRLPCDIQKVRAVYKPELYQYRDVIVFSTKGVRSLASKLAGGDYDGDTAVVIWDPEIVNAFNYHDRLDLHMDPPSDFKAKYFDTRTERMRTFIERPHLACHDLMRVTHSACDNRDMVGKYSKLHESDEYCFGLANPQTMATAHKFNIILDGAKNGDQIKHEVYLDDQKRPMNRVPCYKIASGKETGDRAKRASGLGPHVLDVLWDRGREFVDEMLHEYEEHIKTMHERDLDLSKPWLEFEATVDSCTDVTKPVLDRVRRDILGACEKARASYAKTSSAIAIAKDKQKKELMGKEKAAGILAQAREERASVRSELYSQANLSIGVALAWDVSRTRRLIASCLFYIDAHRKKSGSSWPPDPDAKIAFTLALDDLCEIKASLSGARYYSVLIPFLNHMPPRVRD